MVEDEKRQRILANNYVNVSTAAELLGITPSAVNQRLNRGLMKFDRVNPDNPRSKRVIPLSEIERDRRLRTKAEAEQLLNSRFDDLVEAIEAEDDGQLPGQGKLDIDE